LPFSYWIDNLGFLLREKLAAVLITPSSWGFQLAGYFTSSTNAIKLCIIITTPSRHQLQDIPPPAPRHPNDQRTRPPPPPHRSL
jgi:hypothetical protein